MTVTIKVCGYFKLTLKLVWDCYKIVNQLKSLRGVSGHGQYLTTYRTADQLLFDHSFLAGSFVVKEINTSIRRISG